MRPEDSAEYLRSLVALPLSDAVDADCSFTALLTWARREGLLEGQRNRVIERALVRLRNLIAHPERFHRTHPVSAALPIRDAIEADRRHARPP